MRDFSLLAPPYRQFAWVTDALPALGSIAIGTATCAERIAGELRALLARAPWCVPCVRVSPATAHPDVLSAIHALPGDPAFLDASDRHEPLVCAVLRAARHRPLPSARQLAAYVTERIGQPPYQSVLMALLADPSDAASGLRTSLRTVRDRLRRIGPLTPRCWRNLGVLCRLGAGATGEPIDVLAWRAGIDPRTLRAWTTRYLGRSPQDLRLLMGWEWILEAALRKAGYVEVPAMEARTPAPSSAPRRAAVPRSMRSLGWTGRDRSDGAPTPGSDGAADSAGSPLGVSGAAAPGRPAPRSVARPARPTDR